MKIGLNILPLRASVVAEGGRVAEECGFSSVWLGEHLFAPVRMESAYMSGEEKLPFDHDSPMLDPMLVLASIAAVTRTIRLGVGIYLIALRHPLLTAKSFATLDALSGGRFDFGYGVGWLREEFDVLGVDFTARGKIADEALKVMEVLFRDRVPSIETEHFKLPPMGFEPKPTTSRFIGGGYSPPAWRRAATQDGWYGRIDRLDPETNETGEWNLGKVRDFVGQMREKVAASGRNPEAFEMIGGIYRQATREELDQLAQAGLDEVVINAFPKANGRHFGVTESFDSIYAYAEAIELNK
ncbi:conserved hypothetical protein [Hyphomicrobiales bacterium]|nr:conserved hypothetical protein [Hyphomicrobiales bacterium]